MEESEVVVEIEMVGVGPTSKARINKTKGAIATSLPRGPHKLDRFLIFLSPQSPPPFSICTLTPCHPRVPNEESTVPVSKYEEQLHCLIIDWIQLYFRDNYVNPQMYNFIFMVSKNVKIKFRYAS